VSPLDTKTTVDVFWLFFALLVLIPLVDAGCTGADRVPDAPLDTAREQQLRSRLVGTWRLVGTRATPDAPLQRDETQRVTWTFRADGTGTYRRKRPVSGREETGEFDWELEGRNIRLRDLGGTDELYYRAESWSAAEMTWFKYASETYLVLEPDG
jgi:hypothetical protein